MFVIILLLRSASTADAISRRAEDLVYAASYWPRLLLYHIRFFTLTSRHQVQDEEEIVLRLECVLERNLRFIVREAMDSNRHFYA